MKDRRAHVSGALALTIAFGAGVGSWSASHPSLSPLSVEARRATRVLERVTAETLPSILATKDELLARSVQLSITSDSGGHVIATWKVSLEDHPSWIVYEDTRSDRVTATVSVERIRQHLISYPIAGLAPVVSCPILREWTDPQGVIRAETGCAAREGYEVDTLALARLVANALLQSTPQVTMDIPAVQPKILASGGSGRLIQQDLVLLVTGHSNFKGSGGGRKANVRKALDEHLNNVIVPAGAVFSFNKVLGDRVSISRGWHMALTIFNGNELKPAPGGGICQASTTLYRAALRAGFPIVKQKNHSLYVTYYEQYGVGQDATIFMGSQDLQFLNDSPGPLLIQSGHDGDEAFVRIFGIDDHRSVTLSGPYFASTPVDEGSFNKKLRSNEIGWKRIVQMVGKEPVSEVTVARYQNIPKSLAKRSPLLTVQVRGTQDVALLTTVAAETR